MKENLHTSDAFGAESSIESHESRRLPNEPPKKGSRAVSLVSVRKRAAAGDLTLQSRSNLVF